MGYFLQIILCKSERSVLARKMGPCWKVKCSPVFESNLAPLNQGILIRANTTQLPRADADLDPGAEGDPAWTKRAF